MNLNKLAVRVPCTLLITSRDGTAGTGHRIRRFAEDQPGPAGRHDHGIGRKRFQLKRLQVHRDQAAANLMIVEHERKHLPAFVFCDLSVDFPFADLLVECVQKLLAGRCTGKCRSVMQRSAKTAKIHQAFFRSRKRHAHSIEQIDDLGAMSLIRLTGG